MVIFHGYANVYQGVSPKRPKGNHMVMIFMEVMNIASHKRLIKSSSLSSFGVPIYRSSHLDAHFVQIQTAQSKATEVLMDMDGFCHGTSETDDLG